MEITKQIIFGSFIVAFLVALASTPLAIRIAPKIGAMDIPRDERRMHTHAMPRFGGMAIFLGTEVSLLFFLSGNSKILPVIIGGAMIYALGVWDDLKNLGAHLKFGIEVGVAILMYAMGLRIEFITNYFGEGTLKFGVVICFIVTILWIVGITNTINLVDGLDGLAAGMAAIASLSVAYVAYIHGDRFGMLIVCAGMMAVAGGALGFLPYPGRGRARSGHGHSHIRYVFRHHPAAGQPQAHHAGGPGTSPSSPHGFGLRAAPGGSHALRHQRHHGHVCRVGEPGTV